MNRIDAVRRFNRFYTRRVGALHAALLGSPYPLPEARVIYELGQRGECTASELGARPGPRPRLSQPPAAGAEAARPAAGEAAADDARRVRLTLTAKGRKVFGELDARSRDEVGAHAGQAAGRRSASGWSARCRPSRGC